MGPKKLRVPTLLSTLAQLTHASLRSPVSKPLIPCPGTRSRHQAQIFSPRRQAEPHPQGNSAVINIKP